VGEICMNQTMVDVTEMDDVHVGDEVEVMGPQIKADELAQWGGMELLEVLTSFSGIKYIYINDNQS